MKIGSLNEINRVNWIEKTLKKIPSQNKILDAGAGEQQFKRFCKHLKYYCQDFGEYNGQGDGSALQTGQWNNNGLDYVCDIIDMPVEDNFFDAVMCTEVLEHLPDPVRAIEEMARVIKPNGYFLLTAPFCSLTHFSPYHFASGFNRYFYEHHLNRLGFEIIECTPNGDYFSYLAQELKRIPFVASSYSAKLPKLMIKPVIGLMLVFLSYFQKHDKGSNELLCYGYHLFARKKVVNK